MQRLATMVDLCNRCCSFPFRCITQHMIIFLTCSDSSSVKWRRRFGAGAKDTADATAAIEAEHMYNEPIKYPFNECCLGVRVYYFNLPGQENAYKIHTTAHWSLMNCLCKETADDLDWKKSHSELRRLMSCHDQRSFLIHSEIFADLLQGQLLSEEIFWRQPGSTVLFSSSFRSPRLYKTKIWPSLCWSATTTTILSWFY